MRAYDPINPPPTGTGTPTTEMDMPSMPRPGPDGADPPPAPVDTASLVVRRGPQQGNRYPVAAGTTSLGRDRNCDIVLDDTTVSRRHAEIRYESERFVLVDSGSLNGTYVNRVVRDRADLTDGDEVWVGKFRMSFHNGSVPQ